MNPLRKWLNRHRSLTCVEAGRMGAAVRYENSRRRIIEKALQIRAEMNMETHPGLGGGR